jgi:hypothetical protein
VAIDMADLPTMQAGRESPRGHEELLDLRTLRIADTDLILRRRDSPPEVWRIDEAFASAHEGWHAVRIDATLQRNRSSVKVVASLADLSQAGRLGAASDGRIECDWGETKLTLAGRIPLARATTNLALTADLQSQRPNDFFAFLGVARRPMAPLAVHLEAREVQGHIDFLRIEARLGKQQVAGEGRLSWVGSRPDIALRLQIPYLDMARLVEDVGAPPPPPPDPTQSFGPRPYAWWLITALQGTQGHFDVTLGGLKFHNGIEMRATRANMRHDDDRLDIAHFEGEMMGGHASGRMQLDGRRKAVKLDFDGTGLLLERWFRERGSKTPFTGGPMKVKASFSATGASLRDLAGSVTGPATIRMGAGLLASPRVGEAESKMTQAFSAHESEGVEFQCAGINLHFRDGVAQGESIIGARSSASQLLTSGRVDFREQQLHLHGRLKPRSGVALATIAGDVQVTGRLNQPHMSLEKPAAMARTGIAIATLGLSAAATALADRVDARDSCEAMFGPDR